MAVFAAMLSLSTLVIGPAISGDDTPARPRIGRKTAMSSITDGSRAHAALPSGDQVPWRGG